MVQLAGVGNYGLPLPPVPGFLGPMAFGAGAGCGVGIGFGFGAGMPLDLTASEQVDLAAGAQ